MKNYSIYQFTFPDGKLYIGLTKQNPEDRWANGEGYKGQDVYIPIILFGWDNIKKEILHTNLSKEQAFKLEQHYITKYKTVSNGYNKIGEKEIQMEKGILIDNRANNIINNTEPRIITFEEFLILAEKYPNFSLIYDDADFGLKETTAKKTKDNLIDEYNGGCGVPIIGLYNVSWRLWIGDPPASLIIKNKNTWWTMKEGWLNGLKYMKNEKAKKEIKKFYIDNNFD